MEHDRRFLQIGYRKIYEAAIPMCTMQGGKISTKKNNNKKNTKLDVLTEKHPVLLGVWPATLLCGKAHVCCCCQTRPWWSEH